MAGPERVARVLVVDDDEALCRMLGEALEDDGFAVDCALSGAEALRLAARSRPDVVVLDLVMPGTGGRALAAELRRRLGPDLPVVFASAAAALADAEREADAAGDARTFFLAKPFDLDDLAAVVARAAIGSKPGGPPSA